jgi:hypothetical protein
MMKKVRYLIGAAGALAVTPALGVFPPAAQAATAQSAARPAGKTVSLNYRTAAAIQPGLSSPCDLHSLAANTGRGANKLTGLVVHGGRGVNSCVFGTKAILSHSQTGLQMRTRLYRNGIPVRLPSHRGYVKGTIHSILGFTSFHSSHLNIDATQACEALVYSTRLSKVAYGPVCEDL